MAEAFLGMDVAMTVVMASIVLAGILIGVGRAAGSKRIEAFGFEEFIQSVINAMLIGSFAAVIGFVAMVSSSVVSESCAQGDVVDQLACSLGKLNGAHFALFQELARALNIIGFYQGLSLDFGAFSISPLSSLSTIASALSLQLLLLNAVMILVELNAQIVAFIGQNALALLFPVGLVLRTLFATRKVGGFLIALAVGLYIFYPTFVLIFPMPEPDIVNATILAGNFSNNSFYATVPVLDLNGNYAIAGKLDILSGRCDPSKFNITNMTNVSNTTTVCDDFLQAQNLTTNVTQNMSLDFTGDLTKILQKSGDSLSKSLLYAVVAPIFSLIITIVFVKELANILGSEIGLKTFASI